MATEKGKYTARLIDEQLSGMRAALSALHVAIHDNDSRPQNIAAMVALFHAEFDIEILRVLWEINYNLDSLAAIARGLTGVSFVRKESH